MSRRGALGACLAVCLACQAGWADQFRRFGDWEVHYVVVPSTFLRPQVAVQYGIVRAKDRSLVNVSILNAAGAPTRCAVAGTATNLLGQQLDMDFREVAEASAVYYLAEIKHTNEEVMRFALTITTSEGRQMNVEFQQKLYWEDADAGRAR